MSRFYKQKLGDDITYQVERIMTEGEIFYNAGREAELAKKHKEAYTLYGLAYAVGHAHSGYCLGWYYEHGLGCERDEALAFFYYRKVMQMGNQSGLKNFNRLKTAAYEYKIDFSHCEVRGIKILAVESAVIRDNLKKKTGPVWFDALGTETIYLKRINPHMHYYLKSLGMDYAEQYKKTRDANLYGMALHDVEDCYGCVFKYMIQHYKSNRQ